MNDSVSRSNDANALVETHGPAEICTHMPAAIRDLLGKPPLLANEDPNQYDAVLAALAREVKPNGVTECLLVKDIADLTWEILRYRRIKAAIVNGQFKSALASHLKPAVERDLKAARQGSSYAAKCRAERETPALARDESNKLASDYLADTEIREQMDANLNIRGLDTDTMIAEAFVASIDHMEALDRMLGSAEARCNNALREIERRRYALGRALRQSSDQIIEADAPSLAPSAAA
jgi:hypothetical protein